jgi:shikimate dehydrogenase
VLTRCGVLGSPIAHSLSPALHTAAYRALGLDWRYDAYDVDAAALPGFLADLGPQWRGLSLTMPLKRVVLPLLDEISEVALAAGAVNTVLLVKDGRRTGTNTDVTGMVEALRGRGIEEVGSAAILGGGATAASVAVALARIGCRDLVVHARDANRTRETVEAAYRCGLSARIEPLHRAGTTDVDLVVSTIPAAAQEPLAAQVGGSASVVFDVVYDPWPTPLARAAATAGALVLGGFDLLLHQAALQVELMTGVHPAPVTAMRAAGEAALGGRARPPGA